MHYRARRAGVFHIRRATKARPNATFSISFGDEPTIDVVGQATFNYATNRLLVQLVDTRVTVLLSLAWPADPSVLSLTDPSAAVVWAKLDAQAPSVATSGSIESREEADRWTFLVAAGYKPKDDLGASVTIRGSITTLALP